MKTKTAIIITTFLTLAPVAWAQEPTRLTPDQLEMRAALLRPAPGDLKWRQIPWLTSAAEAQQLARKEQRPIFLWGSDGDPLDRC